MYRLIVGTFLFVFFVGCNNSEVKNDLDNAQKTHDKTTNVSKNDATGNAKNSENTSKVKDLASNKVETSTTNTWEVAENNDATATGNTWSTTSETNWSANTTSPNTNTSTSTNVNTSTSTNVNTSKSVDVNTSVNTNTSTGTGNVVSDGSVILIMKTNDLVEGEDRDVFVKAVAEKWLSGKKYTEIESDTFDEQMGKYEGKKVLTVNVLRAYGEFEITVRSGTVVKDKDGPYEEPIKNWSARGQQTAEDVVKEIKYAKDVFAK